MDELNKKLCPSCGNKKPLCDFHKSSMTVDGLSRICIVCKAISDKSYRERHREKCNAKAKAYRENPEHKKHRNAYTQERRLSDPVFREILNSRSMVAKAMKRRTFSDTSKTAEYICCTYHQLLTHLGRTPEGMSLQLDHICPLSQANTVDEVKALYHYTNLQLASNEANHDKFDGWSEEGEALCLALLGRPWDFTKTNKVSDKKIFKKKDNQ